MFYKLFSVFVLVWQHLKIKIVLQRLNTEFKPINMCITTCYSINASYLNSFCIFLAISYAFLILNQFILHIFSTCCVIFLYSEDYHLFKLFVKTLY